jgi:hypothetical protein
MKMFWGKAEWRMGKEKRKEKNQQKNESERRRPYLAEGEDVVFLRLTRIDEVAT